MVWANSPDKTFPLNVATIGVSADPRQGSFHDTAARSTLDGAMLGFMAATPGAAYSAGLRLMRGAEGVSQMTFNALRTEVQLIQFGYRQYVAPATLYAWTSPVAVWIANPVNVQNATDFVQGLFPGPPPMSPAGVLGAGVGSFVLPEGWYKK